MLVAYGSWCRAVWVPQGRTVGWLWLDSPHHQQCHSYHYHPAFLIPHPHPHHFKIKITPQKIALLFQDHHFPLTNGKMTHCVFFAFILQEPASPKRTNSASRPRHMPGGAITSTRWHFSRMRPSA